MSLTPEQEELNRRRIDEQQHGRYEVNIVLSEELTLKNFLVLPNVLRPETTSAIYLACYLVSESSLYKNKIVLDMGCGSGIQGIVAGIGGADSVQFSDISPEAVENTMENISRFGLNDKAIVKRGDLFENIQIKADLIIFNHPFFGAEPLADFPITRAFFNSGELIHRFLVEAPQHLAENGSIMMPFFHFAGETNSPEIQAPKYGYSVTRLHQENIDDENLQKGLFSIFELRPTYANGDIGLTAPRTGVSF